MNRLVRFSWILSALLVAPAVHAGSSSSPELTDASGDAPAPVDVVAAWFSPLPSSPAVGVPEVDCNVFACREGFQVTVKLRDLQGAAPVADADPATIRYFYDITFTPSTWGKTVLVSCVINVAHHVTAAATNAVQEFPGTHCSVARDMSDLGEAFDAQTTTDVPNHNSQDRGVSYLHVDYLANTLTVTLVEDMADIGPGTAFSDLKVSTHLGYARPTVPVLSKAPADITNVGATWTM